MKTHSRHISSDDAKSIGLIITDLESDPILQDLVLSVHHATTLVLQHRPATKIIENDKGIAFIINELKGS